MEPLVEKVTVTLGRSLAGAVESKKFRLSGLPERATCSKQATQESEMSRHRHTVVVKSVSAPAEHPKPSVYQYFTDPLHLPLPNLVAFIWTRWALL